MGIIEQGVWLTNPEAVARGEYRGVYSLGSGDMEPYGWLHVEDLETEYKELTEVQVKTRVVEALRKKKEKILADAQLQATGIEKEIQQFLALEAPK